jgi:hypothetical protein
MLRRVILIVSIFLCVTLRASPPYEWQTNPAQTIQRPSKHSGLPVLGNFQAKATGSPEERQSRDTREQRYGDHLPEPLVDPGFKVNGQIETSRLTFLDYVKPGASEAEIGLPISESTAIVVGTVASGKCLINSAHTFVYTDYQVKLDLILKPDSGQNLQGGETITASRPGGAIHFPSGHVTNVFDVGHGLPEIGSQYILFLWKTIPSLPEYEIIIDSGYQIKDAQIYALDDANIRFDHMDSAKFIDRVNAMIAKGGSK